MARQLPVYLVFALALAACGGQPVPLPSTTEPVTSSPSPTESPSVTSSPSVEPATLPPGVPEGYGPNDEPGNVPATSLVPAGAIASDPSFATANGVDMILVAYAVGKDPLGQAHGFVVWGRFDSKPHWRPTYGFWDPARTGVLGITTQTGDATGDGSPDALTFESTGGSGACGTWRVIDLAASAAVWNHQGCDATVQLSVNPVGLTLTEAVFKAGDAHCCPSAHRVSELEYDGATFHVTSKKDTPTG